LSNQKELYSDYQAWTIRTNTVVLFKLLVIVYQHLEQASKQTNKQTNKKRTHATKH